MVAPTILRLVCYAAQFPTNTVCGHFAIITSSFLTAWVLNNNIQWFRQQPFFNEFYDILW